MTALYCTRVVLRAGGARRTVQARLTLTSIQLNVFVSRLAVVTGIPTPALARVLCGWHGRAGRGLAARAVRAWLTRALVHVFTWADLTRAVPTRRGYIGDARTQATIEAFP